jgi:RimJ/RimL family protein N-acetyltransferase
MRALDGICPPFVGVGWVGYWEGDWRGDLVYEIGWSVLTVFQGRGIAGSATLEVVAIARSEKKRRFTHAYPSVGNAPSNAICRKLGFALLGPCEFEYPQGSFMHCHDWRLDLFAGRPKSGPPRSAASPPSTLNDDQASN